ncbi:MAG: DUF342 domain-containing protein [bacterium]|nr:DUF342 domain-containing protein [bacterium]
MAESTSTTLRQRTRVTISKDSMTALMVIYPPNEGEPPLTLEEITIDLGKAGVTFGIKTEMIETALANKTYNTPMIVAQGNAPIKGESSRFEYKFDPANNHSPNVDGRGHIDYKDIHFIQNAEANQVLATRTLPTDGVPGMTVTGKEVSGAAGRELPFRHGANTKVSDDGLSLLASVPGAIVYRHGEISVKDTMLISGDVDHNVGNLDCRGSLKVTGDIKAGFNITVDGDLEVNGNVEDSTVTVKGNIMVKGGFFGNGSGKMYADGNITLKFAEGQHLVCGGDLTIGGELINCQATARGSVVVKGKHGKIVGGETRAVKEVRASVLGSDAGTLTILRVAYNSELMQRHFEINKELTRLRTDSQRVKEALYGLYRLQMDGKLGADRLAALKKLEAFQQDFPANMEALEKQRVEVEAKLQELRDARVVAEELLFTGVKAYFGLIYREIVEDLRECKLLLEGHQIVMSQLTPAKH